MVPASLSSLSRITIRGWFWQEAHAMGEAINEGFVTLFTTPLKGKIGTQPSLDTRLEECVRLGRRTTGLDGILRALIELGYSKIAPIKPLLIKLLYELDRRFPVPLPVIPGEVRNTLRVSEPTLTALNSMVRFGAINVTSFADTPPPLRLTEIKSRAWAILQDPDRTDSISKQSAPVVKKCDSRQLKEMAEGVLATQGGVCTTFAAAAVHLLLSDAALMETAPRIEFVSGPKHCLCLINRRVDARDITGALKDTIVSCDLWNDDVVIIDPWAGAMGYHVVSNKTTYPAKLKAMIGLRVDKYFENA